MRLCEVTKQRKKVEEDRTMVEDDDKVMTTRLEERILGMKMLTNTQMNLMNQLMTAN